MAHKGSCNIQLRSKAFFFYHSLSSFVLHFMRKTPASQTKVESLRTSSYTHIHTFVRTEHNETRLFPIAYNAFHSCIHSHKVISRFIHPLAFIIIIIIIIIIINSSSSSSRVDICIVRFFVKLFELAVIVNVKMNVWRMLFRKLKTIRETNDAR